MINLRNIIVATNRYIIAIVYIFSGLVKGIDPTGTAIKIEEYMVSFSLEGLTILADVLSILLCGTELLIGIMLLINLQKQIIASITLIITTIFTLMTLYIYVANPVADCGCFGEAIKLSNGETFIKNIILLLMSVAVYVEAFKKTYIKYYEFNLLNILYTVIILIFSFGVPIYSTINTPLIDSLPYGIGENIQKNMHIPKDAVKDKYEIRLIYENLITEEIVNFSYADTTWHDSKTWKYIETKVKLVEKGFTPKITSFDITNKHGKSVYEDILKKKNAIFLIAYTREDALNISKEHIAQLEDLSNIDGLTVGVLTYGNSKIIEKDLENEFDFYTNVYSVDNVQLKSMFRHNTGIIALQEGTIISKTLLDKDLGINSVDDMDNLFKQQRNNKLIYLMTLILFGGAIIVSYSLLKKD